MNSSDFLKSIGGIVNPAVVASKLSHYISDQMRADGISLYEGYLLNAEYLNLLRTSYLQSAWRGRVRISTCLALFNHVLVADVFGDMHNAEKYSAYLVEACGLNGERRPHYIMDRILAALPAGERVYDDELLRIMSRVRVDYENMSDDDGPFHVEVFPFHYFSAENAILAHENMPVTRIGDAVNDIVIDINVRWV